MTAEEGQRTSKTMLQTSGPKYIVARPVALSFQSATIVLRFVAKGTLLGTKPFARCFPSLVGWTGFRELLCSVPPREDLGMGDVLARRWIFQLDHRAVDPGPVHDERSHLRSSGRAG